MVKFVITSPHSLTDKATAFEAVDGGSIPSGDAKTHPPLAQLVELLPLKEKVVGSNPTGRTQETKNPHMRVFGFR